MTKLKQGSNEFVVLPLEKIIHRLGECSAPQAVEHSSPEILGKTVFYRVLEEAPQK